ncbi:MAG: hypothetical protein ACXWPM_01115 [Bdellovibrionota bacterium]
MNERQEFVREVLRAFIMYAAIVFVITVVSRCAHAAPHGKPARPEQLVIAGLKNHRHLGPHRCLDARGKWVGCK